jgi:hypothetical protein
MKVSKKKPATKAKLEDLAPKNDPKGGLNFAFTGGVTVAAGDVNGDGSAINGGSLSLPAVQTIDYKVTR